MQSDKTRHNERRGNKKRMNIIAAHHMKGRWLVKYTSTLCAGMQIFNVNASSARSYCWAWSINRKTVFDKCVQKVAKTTCGFHESHSALLGYETVYSVTYIPKFRTKLLLQSSFVRSTGTLLPD